LEQVRAVRTSHFFPAVLCLAAALAVATAKAAAAEPSDDVVRAVIDLLGDKDRDMRAVGLEQVREEAKGPAATKRFAAVLPRLSAEAQAGLLDALADRADPAARPAVLEMLKYRDVQVRAAALRAAGSLGGINEVEILVDGLGSGPGAVKTAARAGLIRLRGPRINREIAARSAKASGTVRAELLGVLATRRATDCISTLLGAAEDGDAAVRAAAQAALGQLAGPESVPELVKAVLKAEPGEARDAAERVVMFACNRIADAAKRADPLLAVLAASSDEDQAALLPALGRVGGPKALQRIEAAIAGKDAACRAAGVRALCNWPDGSVAARLYDLARTAPQPAQRTMALAALIRVAPLPDGRPDAQRLAWLKRAWELSPREDDRKLILKRARAIRTLDALHFVVPYMMQEPYAQTACETVVELAHHKQLRQPNKAEFDAAIDAVLRISRDPKLIDRARRYKKGQT
jgi:HEAT repeat protein